MNNVNQTLYIPLYGKAYVTENRILLKDDKAVEIWKQCQIPLKGKSKSKWLAYYMAMRAKVFDEWVTRHVNEDTVVLHLGCGLDSRAYRVNAKCQWYDVDFEEVILERKKYFLESNTYHMVASDVRDTSWLNNINCSKALVVMEGISMYLTNDECKQLFKELTNCFEKVQILVDVYSEFAAKASKYKNPINDVGVHTVYGLDNPKYLENEQLQYIQELGMTPTAYIEQLPSKDQWLFKTLYAGKTASSMYHIYEFRK
ncbi:MAG: class I SAM-dependent methyltransferase [Erysipelotrichaceae bacterium]|nr:class I SAM-dependent methyltransferase [Erysipelotrichaceae bacterium]